MKKIVPMSLHCFLALTFILSLCLRRQSAQAPVRHLLASGSEETSTVAPRPPEAKGPVTLTVYTWWDVTKFEHLQKMKSDFLKQKIRISSWSSLPFPASMRTP